MRADRAFDQHLDLPAAVLDAMQAGVDDAGVVEDQQVAGLEQVLREEAARQNWALDEEQTLELLRMDIDLNAQGLGIWLDSQRAVEMQPA